jgi:ubiquinone/menaquinone biosynthesis C-methylase UbiE
LSSHGRPANLSNVVEPVIRAFDDVAPVYDTVLPFFARFGAELAAWLPPSTHGDRLLDLGAGIGAVATPALERGYAVLAIDRSTAMVTRLQAEHPAIDARVMDAASLDFEDGSFDVVTAGFVMHLLPDPSATIREVRRVLRPGGTFMFTVPGRVPDGVVFHDAANALFEEFAAHLPPDGGMGRPFAEVASLQSAGFVGVRERALTVEIPLADGETLWRWLQTHGTRKFLDDLSDEHRGDFHRRLVADVDARATKALHRYAWLFTAYA